ncbi:MAG: hemerythrin domain-containing protein [Thermoguttaceae bacterium]|jgi:hemerythrin-like domain-containing protein
MVTRRRDFLLAGAALGIGGAAGRTLLAADAAQPAEEVSAVEDLMREHGVLRRIMLIYEECVRQLRSKSENFDAVDRVLLATADLVRKFVEDYHEKLEENHLFPVFEKHGELVPLVNTLREQHAAGRALTDPLLRLAASAAATRLTFQEPRLRKKAVVSCEAFLRMYRPHAAREDTVLFPAFKKLLSAKQLDELGDKFEDEENRRFGADGFGKMVEKVAAIEKQLGICNLSQFTPQVTK